MSERDEIAAKFEAGREQREADAARAAAEENLRINEPERYAVEKILSSAAMRQQLELSGVYNAVLAPNMPHGAIVEARLQELRDEGYTVEVTPMPQGDVTATGIKISL